jgi:hypothetical protein
MPESNLATIHHDGFSIQQVPSGIKEFLQSAVDVNEQGVYCDPVCPICTSSHRESSETLWRSLGVHDKERIDKVVAHLSGKGLPLSREVVSNHIRVHMGAGEAEIRKMEYIRKLTGMGSVRITPLDRLEFMMDAISERIAASGSITDNDRISKVEAEKLRSDIVGSLSKAGESLLKLHIQMEKDLEATGNMVRIHKESFKKAFDSALSASKTERERQLLNNLMTELIGNAVA